MRSTKTHLLALTGMLLALGSGCGGSTTVGEENPETTALEIDHYFGLCSGMGSWYCPRAREVGGDAAWENLACGVQGLDVKWGHHYELEVTTKPREQVPDDCGDAEQVVLAEVVGDTAVEAGTRFSYDVGGYELYGDGTTVYLGDEPMRCEALCSELWDLSQQPNTKLRLTFEHDAPGSAPRLVDYTNL